MRLAVTSQWLILLFALLALPVTATRADDLPPCTSAEFRAIFDQIAAIQLELSATIGSVEEVLEFARANIAKRSQLPEEAPNCADAFALRRLTIELTGDAIGRAALDLIDMPPVENPYRQHLASDQDRIEHIAAKLLGADRSLAPERTARRLTTCASEQLSALNDSLTQFRALLALDAPQPALIDAFLRWREVSLPQAPACADGIALVLLLSQSATDAAASQALDLLAQPSENPYANPLANSQDRLESWQSELQERLAESEDRAGATPKLPACRLPELANAYALLMPAYSDLLQQARQINRAEDLPAYSAAYFDFRESQLGRMPACAEAFALSWETRQLLGDLLSGAARDMTPWAEGENPFEARVAMASANLASMIDKLAYQLEESSQAAAPPALEAARLCSGPEMLFLQVYLLPEFHAFTAASLAAEEFADLDPLSQRSFTLRELLLRELPHCAEALELGIVMGRIAADFVAMLWLEAAGLPIAEIAQAQAVVADMRWLLARAAGLGSVSLSAEAASKNYFVSGERGANIRACASTECQILATALRGEPIDILEASGNWYKVNLPNDQVGYIASFLVSSAQG